MACPMFTPPLGPMERCDIRYKTDTQRGWPGYLCHSTELTAGASQGSQPGRKADARNLSGTTTCVRDNREDAGEAGRVGCRSDPQ